MILVQPIPDGASGRLGFETYSLPRLISDLRQRERKSQGIPNILPNIISRTCVPAGTIQELLFLSYT